MSEKIVGRNLFEYASPTGTACMEMPKPN